MRTAITLGLCCGIVVALCAADWREPGYTLRAKVVEVYDGDTVTVEVTHRFRCRLIDCWAPEIRGGDEETKRAGQAAKEHLAKLIDGKDVTLFVPVDHADLGKSTTLGRVLGRVFVDGKDVSELMVKSGLAQKTKSD